MIIHTNEHQSKVSIFLLKNRFFVVAIDVDSILADVMLA